MKTLKRIKDMVLRLSFVVSLFTIFYCAGRPRIGTAELVASGIAITWSLLMMYANE